MRAPVLGSFSAAAVWCTPGPAAHIPVLADALGIRRCLPHLDGVALTFDDGPDADGTPPVLETLAAVGARASFFLVGEQVERRPELAAAIASAGHEIGLHGYRHRNLLLRAPAELRADLDRGVGVIAEATGREPVFYRAPYGVFSLPALLEARRRGWTPLLWSRWGREWARGATPELVACRAGSSLKRGDVVLLHDSDRYGPEGFSQVALRALPAIVERIRERGLEPVSLSRAG
jgi:peptidoglycan/xylan/chitin deacetylase (PgdA/CDA1 family)